MADDMNDRPRGECVRCGVFIYWTPGRGLHSGQVRNATANAWCMVGQESGHQMFLPNLANRDELEAWLAS